LEPVFLQLHFAYFLLLLSLTLGRDLASILSSPPGSHQPEFLPPYAAPAAGAAGSPAGAGPGGGLLTHNRAAPAARAEKFTAGESDSRLAADNPVNAAPSSAVGRYGGGGDRLAAAAGTNTLAVQHDAARAAGAPAVAALLPAASLQAVNTPAPSETDTAIAESAAAPDGGIGAAPGGGATGVGRPGSAGRSHDAEAQGEAEVGLATSRAGGGDGGGGTFAAGRGDGKTAAAAAAADDWGFRSPSLLSAAGIGPPPGGRATGVGAASAVTAVPADHVVASSLLEFRARRPSWAGRSHDAEAQGEAEVGLATSRAGGGDGGGGTFAAGRGDGKTAAAAAAADDWGFRSPSLLSAARLAAANTDAASALATRPPFDSHNAAPAALPVGPALAGLSSGQQLFPPHTLPSLAPVLP
jgi:hypothetical protein